MKHLFIVNPAAGKTDQTEYYTKHICAACRPRGLDFEIAVSQHPGDCFSLARAAAKTGEPLRLYACGGDGTLNEVVNGAAGFSNAAVTHYAGGSGNDFVKLFSDPSAFRDVERLLNPQEAEIDLICCNGDYALNVCSVGLDARIGTDVVKYKRLPLLSGFGAYALSAAVNTVKGVAEHYVVEIDGETVDGEQTLVLAANGRHYGGGFHPVPDADPQDGLLDVLLVTKVSRWKVLSVIGKYQAGKYAQFPQLIRHVRTKSLTIHCDRETPINLDGELRMDSLVHISMASEKLRFFFPRDVSLT
ncbi:MAG TPA: YegS/Rv2252/BmrU family lipid kinase [Candidatus Faecousia intestinigallinarum]|nr:YegS/Rv2252/BmrU family lipid kinase [Candidatus Faecousia intestinigallinarum]